MLYNHVTGDYYPRVFPSAIVYIQLHIYLYLFSRDIGVAHDADLLLDCAASSLVVGPSKSPPPPLQLSVSHFFPSASKWCSRLLLFRCTTPQPPSRQLRESHTVASLPYIEISQALSIS